MKKYVFRFDIAMDNITVMHELDCMGNLLYDASYFLLGKSAFTSKVVVDIASTAQLQNQVKVLLIREE